MEGDTEKTLGTETPHCRPQERLGLCQLETPGGCCHLSMVTSTVTLTECWDKNGEVLWMGDHRKEGGPKGEVSSQRKADEEFSLQR